MGRLENEAFISWYFPLDIYYNKKKNQQIKQIKNRATLQDLWQMFLY